MGKVDDADQRSARLAELSRLVCSCQLFLAYGMISKSWEIYEVKVKNTKCDQLDSIRKMALAYVLCTII